MWQARPSLEERRNRNADKVGRLKLEKVSRDDHCRGEEEKEDGGVFFFFSVGPRSFFFSVGDHPFFFFNV